MDPIARFIVPHLPPDLQALYLAPPSLSDPSSFIPLIRTLLPYTWYLVVLVAFYIVWTTTMSILGYFGRFLRFTMKVGPLLALAGWVMANSGQGGVAEVFQAAQEWIGLAPQSGRQWSDGIANLFGTSNTRRRSSNSGGFFGLGGDADPISSRTRGGKKGSKRTKAGDGVGDVFNDILQSATGAGDGGDWQETVQGYVKQALLKASGMDWLFGTGGNDRDRTSTRSR